MDFEDTPEETQFRAGVRALLAKAAEPRAPGTGMIYRAGNEDPEFRQRAKGLAGKESRCRLRRHHLAHPLGRRQRHPAGDLRSPVAASRAPSHLDVVRLS